MNALSKRAAQTGWLLLMARGLASSLALLSPDGLSAATWHVPGDAPTIQAAVDSAQAGDDVLIAPGEYHESEIRLTTGGVTIHSEGGAEVTIVDAERNGSVFVCEGFNVRSVIAGLTLREGWNVIGGGLRAEDATLEVRDCIVESCHYGFGGGIAVVDCDATLRRLTIRENTAQAGGGVYGFSSHLVITGCDIRSNGADLSGAGIAFGSGTLEIRDTIIANNVTIHGDHGVAVHLENAIAAVTGSTITGNFDWTGNASILRLESSQVTVERSIVAFNDGNRAFWCLDSSVGMRCVNSYDPEGDDSLCGTDLGGNFSADPLFCDLEGGDYTLDAASPCLPGQHPDGVECGRIGALGLGCGATPVETTTWGRIKGAYR